MSLGAVADGKADSGYCSASVLRDWGAGRRLVALAAIFQRSAAVIWSRVGRHQQRGGTAWPSAHGYTGK